MSAQDVPGTARIGARAAHTVRLQGGHLIVQAGPDRGRRFAIGPSALTIGSAADNDVVLIDGTVSKHHLVIEETTEGFVLRDLRSTNGTFLDGTRVREAYLAEGAVIGLGATRLRFDPPGARVAVPAASTGAFGGLIGRSERMRELFGILEQVAPLETTVLITGETGTGKEVAAQAVHDHSPRASGPFVVLDASATPRDLFESILSGHREGAFTGASGERKGLVVSAERGTLFIDEIGELPLELQPKLLRVLEKREVLPLGADRPRKVDVRVLAATHRDLRAMVEKGAFRQDLYYRLSVLEVRLPALRERLEDVAPIAERLLAAAGRPDLRLASDAFEELGRRRWNGNVRELKNTLERALVFCGAGPIRAEHLGLAETAAREPARDGNAGERSLEQVEAEAIRATLERTKGNRTQAARILRISRRSLIERIARHGLDRIPDE